MVCKEDVVSWFKELESYKRIDAMCSLLNMCLPFELRFIGTYLEELGKRDFQELRGAEVRANSNADLAADIGGANTDHRTRRKMALYVSLLRSCNYACASTLYNVMVGLEQSGLLGGVYGDPLEELLLLYTMALHHPAFTFDQHTHFGEILEKLKLEDERTRYNPPPVSVNTAPTTNSCILHTSVAPNLSVPPPSVSGLAPMNTLVYVKTPPLQGQPVSSEQMGEMINPVVGMGNQPLPPNEPMYSCIISEGMHLPHSAITALPHYSMGEYIVGQSHWGPAGLIMTTLNQPVEMLTYPPPPSPLVSQPSSPCDSRPGSPPRAPSVPPPAPHLPPRPSRRPSQDSTPPPHQVEHGHLVPSFNSLSINERHLEEEKLHDPDFQLKAMAQLQSIENQNGMRRLSGRRGGGVGGTYCSTQLLRSTLHHQSSGSDSGSSTGSHSPPAVERPRQPPSPSPAAHFPVPLPRSAFPTFPPAYRPSFSPSPFPANGEGMYHPHYPPGFLPVPLYAPPKLSCWNCGATGHSGADCKEPSIDDMTRAAVYHLDYSTAPPDNNDK